MCLQWTRVLYSIVIPQQSNPPISQFNSPNNEFTSGWSMFVYNKYGEKNTHKTITQLKTIMMASKKEVELKKITN